jgi:hypothetical protein
VAMGLSHTQYNIKLTRGLYMNKDNEKAQEVFSVEELESRFEMEAIVDNGGVGESDITGTCTCTLNF